MLTLRYMQLPDIPFVADIDKQSFNPPWSARSYQYEINESTYSHMVTLERTGGKPTGLRKLLSRLQPTNGADPVDPLPEVVGYGGLWSILDEAHISTIAAHPQERGRGYGEILLMGMIRKAFTLNAAYLVLEVRVSNAVAQNLYTKHGFSIFATKPRYYHSDGEDAYDMRLDLTNAEYRTIFEPRYADLIERHALTDTYTHSAHPRRTSSD